MAVFGVIVLGEPVTWPRLLAIAIASAGVLLVARKPGEGWSAQSVRPAMVGVASGALFAVAAIGFRGAILALPEGAFFVRATTTLAWSLGIQSLLLGLWMALFDRAALARTFGATRRGHGAACPQFGDQNGHGGGIGGEFDRLRVDHRGDFRHQPLPRYPRDEDHIAQSVPRMIVTGSGRTYRNRTGVEPEP